MPERKIEYSVLAHKADTGLRVTAPSWARLYIDSALALTDKRVQLDLIKEDAKQTVKVKGKDKETLFVKWLNEVLVLFEKDKFLCRRIVFDSFDLSHIEATLWGDTYEGTRHGSVSEIKAVTYHELKIGEVPDALNPEFAAQFYLDL